MLRKLGMLLGVLAALLAATSAQADRRVALVIGNSSYVHATALRNPKNDAADLAETLKRLGFEVHLGLDLDQRGFATTIEKFARDLEGADVGLFFYAGHALQINEKNYLVSTAARLENEFLVSSETMELEPVIRLMESKAPINLVFLDACRNNPLADNLRRNLAALKRSANLGRGLARVDAAGRDTLIAFAAAPGQEAADGSDRNSPFTAALLKHIPTPGLEVSVMLKEVTADVRRETRNMQRPQQLSDMSRVFYFASADPSMVAKPAAPTPQAVARQSDASADDRALDVAYWNSAQTANDCESVRAYLQRFRNGAFVELAKLAERRLCAPARRVSVEPGQGDASLTPPPAGAFPQIPAPPPEARQPNIGALPEVAMLPSAQEAEPSADRTGDLARNVQLELIRLGCVSGDADGNWGKSTKDALRKFNRFARASLGAEEPTSDMLSTLREHDERACPLECGRGFRARGGVCVAVEPREPPKSRNTGRRQERENDRAPAAAAPARQKSAAPLSMPKSPLCQSRTQVGGKWCCTYDPERGPSIIICD